jgi:hypothetical protein
MKRIYKPSLGSIHGSEPATSTSKLITSTAPASDATASAQGTANVSIQLCPSSHLTYIIEQTAHCLGISTSVSALEISDFSPVSVPAVGVNLATTSYITAID